MRVLITLLVFGLLSVASVFGQEPKEPPLEETIYKLKAKPATPPLPSLKYELIPSVLDQTTNNAALMYHRALLLAAENRGRDPEFAKLQNDALEALERPLRDTPKELLRKYTSMYSGVIKELEAAARCNHCDWGTMQRIQEEGIALLLPEIQHLREVANALRARARLHASEGKYELALRDIQTGLTLAHYTGQGSTFIQYLVGVAIGTMFFNELDQVIQVEGCPNLYWSLTALPRPLVDIRKGIEGEFRSIEKTIAFPKDLDKGPMSNEQANAALDKLFKILVDLTDEPPLKSTLQSPSYARLFLAGYVTLQYPSAKKALLEAGKTEVELETMPAAQIVMLDSMIRCRNLRDEFFVWITAPYPEAIQGMKKAHAQYKEEKKNFLAIPQQLLILLLPAVEKIYVAEIRLARRVASLRTVEAIRLHAAKNDGALPGKLSDITVVPVPVDPLTNLPFEYSVQDRTGTITVVAPSGEKSNRGNSWKYQITLTK